MAILFMMAGSTTAAEPVNENAAGAKGLDTALIKLHAPLRDSQPLSPQDEQSKFKLRDGLAVDLIAAEPAVRQPLYLTFDERGRMWVVQYIQYPVPAGLKVVSYDQYLRAKFDKVPEPPPKGVKGQDVISILEDTDGDGTYDKQKTFADGLNLCTAALPGRGGVWVLNPPYLLYYPDKNRDDVPDADPVVHLSGFGLEDTHAVANSLTWGPDGWLYGAHGSTCTSKLKVEVPDPKGVVATKTTDFLGQCIWRYHPTRHVFEIFAEGGGNTFGVEFDDWGNCFSGTNWGKYHGLHYVQGGYYVKGWGKHGPLTNPHAYGFFEHMPHDGNADRLTHTFVVYGGGLLNAADYDGKILGANSLQSRITVSRLHPLNSTFRTSEEEPLLTSDDGWFRPVDIKAGPDGALYVADFYEQRISHVDPRDNWHRGSGRIWRIRPADWKPAGKPAADLGALPSAEVVRRLWRPNRWERATARRVLAERGNDAAAANAIRGGSAGNLPIHRLEQLWALHAVGALDDRDVATRISGIGVDQAWMVRLLADDNGARGEPGGLNLFAQWAEVAREPALRSQLASSAKRLPGRIAVPVIDRLLNRNSVPRDGYGWSDADDPHLPLLLWWAVEAHAVPSRDLVVDLFKKYFTWTRPVVRDTILPRLARRYASDESPENYAALVRLLDLAPGQPERKIILDGVKEAFAVRPPTKLTAAFTGRLAASDDPELTMYTADPSAVRVAIKWAQLDDADAPPADRTTRLRLIAALGALQPAGAADALVEIVAHSTVSAARAAALTALANVDDPDLGAKLTAMLPALQKDKPTAAAAVRLLCGRADWAAALLAAVEAKSVDKSFVPPEQVDRLRELADPALDATVARVYGKPKQPTSEQARAEIDRVAAAVLAGPAGNADAGKQLFTARCANCHALFGQGGKVGPDLTGYARADVRDMAFHVVDPSGFVREEYAQFAVRTRNGQTFVGIVTARDANFIELTDTTGQRTTIAKGDVKLERALPTSAMPAGLISDLSDAQLRDFFAYLSMPDPRGVKKN